MFLYCLFPFGVPPIFIAIQSNNTFAIDLLLEGDANLDVRDMRGRTFLHYCCEYNFPNLIFAYFMKGMAKNQDKWSYNGPIHNACYGSIESFKEVLKPWGVPDPDAPDEEEQAEEDDENKPEPVVLIRAILDAKLKPSVQAVHGETPLHLAAAAGSLHCVSILLALSAEVDAHDNCGSTPLHYAVMEGRTQIAGSLVKSGADVNHKDNDGNTALHIAAGKNSPEIIRLLQSLNGDVNAKNTKGRTPLHVAAEFGNKESVEELLQLGADPNARDVRGVSF